MSDPEIDRRCTFCGASARARALFCPQCGQPVAEHAQYQEPANEDDDGRTNANENNPTIRFTPNSVPDLSETQPLRATPDLSATQPLIAVPDLSQTQPLIRPSEPVPDQKSQLQTPGSARGLEGSVLGRVEKIRKVSTVVIDQAAYDPSIRFLLVAAFLFLLFLFLLLLSKVIG